MPNDEVFDFQCPKCGKRLKAGAAFAGRRVKCPKCSQPVSVPGERQSAPPPAGSVDPSPVSVDPSKAANSPLQAAPLKSVPVVSADDDWLNLGGPAIADLSERQQAVEENKLSKERERVARRNKEQQRQLRAPQVTAESLEQASQQRLRGQQPLPSGGGRVEDLEDDLPGLAPVHAEGKSTARGSAKSPAAGQPEVKRSIFDDDLPELSELHAPTPSKSADKLLANHAGIELSELDNLSTLVPDLGSVPAVRGKSSGKTAARPAGKSTGQSGLPALFDDKQADGGAEDKDPEYRIECKACGTAQYVRLSLQGKKIKCPDCYLEFKIPPPPPGWSSKKKAKLQLTGEDIPLSAAEELNHAEVLQSQRTRTAQMLQKAKQQVSEDDLDSLYDGDFDTAGFVQRTFGFFKDPVAVAHVIGYGFVFAGLFALGQFAANNLESTDGRRLLLLTVIGAPLAGMLFALPMLNGGLALLESVANRQKRVSEWPGFNLFDNAGDIAAITIALLAALMPGYLIGSWLSGEGAGAGRIQIGGMMVTTFALFPILLLSMLDNGSVFAPLSNSVFRSLSEAAEAWGGYYLKTLIAFSGTMLLWLLLLGKHEALAAAAGFLLPLLVFFTCQQMGALADAIGEHLSFEWVPPEEDEKSVGTEGSKKKNGGREQQFKPQ